MEQKFDNLHNVNTKKYKQVGFTHASKRDIHNFQKNMN